MTGELILLADDEPSSLQLARYLEQEGFRVQSAADGETALQAVKQHRPALVVLNVGLPRTGGLEICRRLRAEGSPVAIILLAARGDEIDRVLGLEMGADDTLTRPINPRELAARVRAILRRSERKAAILESEIIRVGDITIDPAAREVRAADRPLELRTQEFDLLLALAGHPGRVFSREQLLQQAWGADFRGQTRTVDVHVAHLRKKLAGSRARIETVTGIGYKLVP